MADYNIGADRAFTQLIVPYPDDMYSNDVFNNLKENLDPYLEIIQQDQTKLVFKDYQNKYGVIEIKKNIIQINIHLEKRP